MNDPVALLLVTGFIDWIQMPDYGIVDMVGTLAGKLAIGVVAGVAIGFAARWAFRNLDLPSPGLYPVASIATAALAYGVPELAHGSGFLSVYIAALILGTGAGPGAPDDDRLPPGPLVDRPDLALRPARPARLPERARRGRRRGAAARRRR